MKMHKGTYDLHKDANFNFQMNRVIAGGNGNVDELKSVADKINEPKDWVREISNLGVEAEKKNEIPQAIGYYRMAEFFELDSSPNKMILYNKSKVLFYEYHKDKFNATIERDAVKYDNSELPVWIATPKNKAKDIVVFHGGNDSYMEEYLPLVMHLVDNDIKVYLFEGPGQGAALREHHLPFTHSWNRPVTAVLDYYNLNDITLIGMSMGGMLAPRAAAFEKRISRVVAWGVMHSLHDVILSKVPNIMTTLINLKFKGLINILLRKRMEQEPIVKWAISHGMHSMNVDTPYDYLRITKNFEMESIGDKITQDFLLTGSNEDHFIPNTYYKRVIDALPNVASLTYKMYTKKDSAENHCCTGNTKLVLDDIIRWISNVK